MTARASRLSLASSLQRSAPSSQVPSPRPSLSERTTLRHWGSTVRLSDSTEPSTDDLNDPKYYDESRYGHDVMTQDEEREEQIAIEHDEIDEFEYKEDYVQFSDSESD